MALNSQDIKNAASMTLEHYNERANDFREGTREHDVSQNIAALLLYIEGQAPFTILDLGCGPGRDLKAFKELGHVAVGLEGSHRFAAMAREQGYEVWEQNFLNLDLPKNRFDGIFANASLFHVPVQELSRILLELHATLKPRGVLFSSNPRGHNEEASGGLLSPFKPIADDDGMDLLLFHKVSRKAFPLQIKARRTFDDERAQTVQFDVRLKTFAQEGEGYMLYVKLDGASIGTLWLVPAKDLPSVARQTSTHLTVVPSAKPTSKDRLSPYRATSMHDITARILDAAKT